MKLSTQLLGLALLISSISMAAPPPDKLRYNYVNLGASGGEIDTGTSLGDVDFTQGSISGSWGVHENVALFGGISGGEIETSDVCFCTDIDTAGVSLGVVPHFPLGNNIDILIPVAYEWAELDDGFDTIDDSGYSIGLGIRALLTPAWELSVGVIHVDIGDEDDQSVAGSVRWHIVELFSLSFGAQASSDVTAVTLGGRFTF
jgi:hypothetical protein